VLVGPQVVDPEALRPRLHAALLERIAYRNDRMLDHLAEKDDPVAFVRLMGGQNRTDLRRLAELLGADF
jgi:hypothetical protein